MKQRTKILAVMLSVIFILTSFLPVSPGILAGNAGVITTVETAITGPANTPEPPRVLLDTTYSEPTGSIISVKQGDDLQAAINQAQPGQIIELQAGAIFYGNFTLPAKSGSQWIYIRSADYNSLPSPGTRVNPDYSLHMPCIISPNGSGAITALDNASNYRLIGLEVTTTIADTTKSNNGLIQLGNGFTSTLAAMPHDLIIDRCYIHGNIAGNSRRGVQMNGARCSVIDSYISEIHDISNDSQAVSGTNGPGPFKIVNNYLEAATENVAFGGGDTSIQGMIPSDIEIRNNYLYKPQYWNPYSPTFNHALKIKYTISDGVNPDVTGTINAANTPQLVTTGWTQPGGTVKISFSDGWNSVMDDLTYGDTSGNSNDVTYSFNDLPGNNQVLDGIHSGIDFGSAGRWTGFATSNGFTNCACYTYNSKSESINIPSNKVFKSLKVSSPLKGTYWDVKNIFELKTGCRVLFEGNVLENNWIGNDQWGYAILLTPRNQSGTNNWVQIKDILIKDNIIKNSNCAVEMMGNDDQYPTQLSTRIEFTNNLFYNIDSLGDSHSSFIFLRGGTDIAFHHNTLLQKGMPFSVFDPVTRFDYSNNIALYDYYGLFSPVGTGDKLIDTYFSGSLFTKNIFAGGPGNLFTKYTGNYLNPPATVNDIGFVNYAGNDYHLSASSPYKNAGTDGKDIGANIDEINAATSGVVYTGDRPVITAPPTMPPTPTPTPTPTPDPNATPDPSVPTGDYTYSFDDLTADNQPITGVHGGIDFGSAGAWSFLKSTCNFTNSGCYTNDIQANSISIPAGKVLKSIKFSSYDAGATFTISDGVNPDFHGTIDNSKTPQQYYTGWTKAGSTITISFSDGWNTAMDDITYGDTDTTYSFDDLTDDSQPITGIHGGIDFGSAGIWSFWAKSNNFVKCACFTNDDPAGPITIPSGKVLKSIKFSTYDPGATFTISDGVNPDFKGTIDKLNTPQQYFTGWTKAGSTITISFSDGWNTVMDDIVYGTPDSGPVNTSTPTPTPSPTSTGPTPTNTPSQAPTQSQTPTPTPTQFTPTPTPFPTPTPTPVPDYFARVNFQPASDPAVNGYLVDSGAVYGDKGNGFTYGWSDSYDNGGFKRASGMDYRYDSYVNLGGNYYWEMSVPNGKYNVRVVSGDAEYPGGHFKWMAEGTVVAEGDSTDSNKFVDGTGTVTVSDGRLTLTGENTYSKINFLEISKVQDTTPTPTPTQLQTPSPTPTPTKSQTPSPTPTKSQTPSPTPTKSQTPSPTPTNSSTPSPSPAQTPPVTNSPTPAVSQTPEPTPGSTAEPTAPAVSTPQVTFPDVSADNLNWAVNEIQTLATIGVIKGTVSDDGTTIYNPYENVTRAELTKLTVEAFGIDGSGSDATFTDVPSSSWYYDYVGKAYSNQVIFGTTNTTFEPNAPISRQDMASVVIRALVKYKGITLVNDQDVLAKLADFADQDKISEYARVNAATAVKLGIIKGKDDGGRLCFKPLDNANRAEAAVVIYRVLNVKDTE